MSSWDSIVRSDEATAGQFGIPILVDATYFPSSKVFRMALGLTEPPIQWASGPFSLGVKWLGHGADHSPPSHDDVKNEWSDTSTLPICLHGVYRDNFTSYMNSHNSVFSALLWK
jgi:hypothetical protein